MIDGSVAGVPAVTCGTFVLIQVALVLVLARPPADTPYITLTRAYTATRPFLTLHYILSPPHPADA